MRGGRMPARSGQVWGMGYAARGARKACGGRWRRRRIRGVRARSRWDREGLRKRGWGAWGCGMACGAGTARPATKLRNRLSSKAMIA